MGLSTDGNTLAVGGYQDDINVGANWIFIRSDTTWTGQAKLVGTGYENFPEEGFSTALSADGDTLAVGGPLDNNNGGSGVTLVFVDTN